MTIKQQGGIFGRNPSFNDVEIDDLTVTGSSTLNGAFSVQGTAGKLNQTASGNLFQIAQGMNTEAAVVQLGSGRTGTGNSYFDFFSDTGVTYGARLIKNPGVNGGFYVQAKGTSGLYLRTDDAAPVVIQTGGAEAARFNTSGNLAFPSGQGIDFSATAGTGTSELFDDYEEGTWTPTVATDGADGTYTVTVNTATYTKVGNSVRVSFYVTVAVTVVPTGAVSIGGLPFNAAEDTAFSNALDTLTASTGNGYLLAGSPIMRFTEAGSASWKDMVAGAVTKYVMVSAVYRSA
jgi:hypothetical protein